MNYTFVRLVLISSLLNFSYASLDAILPDVPTSALAGDFNLSSGKKENDAGDSLSSRENKKRKNDDEQLVSKKAKTRGIEPNQDDTAFTWQDEDILPNNDDDNHTIQKEPAHGLTLRSELAFRSTTCMNPQKLHSVPQPITQRTQPANLRQRIDKVLNFNPTELTLEQIEVAIKNLRSLLRLMDAQMTVISAEELLLSFAEKIDLLLARNDKDSLTLNKDCKKAAGILNCISDKSYKWPLVINASKKAIETLLYEITVNSSQSNINQLKLTCQKFIIVLCTLLKSKESSNDQKCEANILIGTLLFHKACGQKILDLIQQGKLKAKDFFTAVMTDETANQHQRSRCAIYLDLIKQSEDIK